MTLWQLRRLKWKIRDLFCAWRGHSWTPWRPISKASRSHADWMGIDQARINPNWEFRFCRSCWARRAWMHMEMRCHTSSARHKHYYSAWSAEYDAYKNGKPGEPPVQMKAQQRRCRICDHMEQREVD